MSSIEELNRLLYKKCRNKGQCEYTNIKGYTFVKVYEKFENSVQTATVYDDDVWVCTYPKCGTTWTQEMVWLVGNNLNFKGAEMPLSKRFPFFDMSTTCDFRKLQEENSNHTVPETMLDSINYTNNTKRPRFIKTHLPYELLPDAKPNGTKRPKMVYVTRNAKDTCISYYHYCRWLLGYTVTFEEFCELFLAGKLLYSPYWKHVLSYRNQRDSSNILFLKFEDMKSNMPGVISKVANYLGRHLTESQIKTLVEHLDFKNMKKNPAFNYTNDRPDFLGLRSENGDFFRSGKVGEHKMVMSPEMIKRFDEITLKEFENVPDLIS